MNILYIEIYQHRCKFNSLINIIHALLNFIINETASNDTTSEEGRKVLQGSPALLILDQNELT